jgi:50S ribosomal protein L16 3-hydroxylase
LNSRSTSNRRPELVRRDDAGKATPAIEAWALPRRLLGMPPSRFLRDYWQKRPLLIRGAFPQFHNAITPEDLAGLACEEAALARLVLRDARRDHWTLRNAPFTVTRYR